MLSRDRIVFFDLDFLGHRPLVLCGVITVPGAGGRDEFDGFAHDQTFLDRKLQLILLHQTCFCNSVATKLCVHVKDGQNVALVNASPSPSLAEAARNAMVYHPLRGEREPDPPSTMNADLDT